MPAIDSHDALAGEILNQRAQVERESFRINVVLVGHDFDNFLRRTMFDEQAPHIVTGTFETVIEPGRQIKDHDLSIKIAPHDVGVEDLDFHVSPFMALTVVRPRESARTSAMNYRQSPANWHSQAGVLLNPWRSAAWRQRQHGIQSVERLDGGLVVRAEHCRVLRRIARSDDQGARYECRMTVVMRRIGGTPAPTLSSFLLVMGESLWSPSRSMKCKTYATPAGQGLDPRESCSRLVSVRD